jgi:hypothetical protein
MTVEKIELFSDIVRRHIFFPYFGKDLTNERYKKYDYEQLRNMVVTLNQEIIELYFGKETANERWRIIDEVEYRSASNKLVEKCNLNEFFYSLYSHYRRCEREYYKYKSDNLCEIEILDDWYDWPKEPRSKKPKKEKEFSDFLYNAPIKRAPFCISRELYEEYEKITKKYKRNYGEYGENLNSPDGLNSTERKSFVIGVGDCVYNRARQHAPRFKLIDFLCGLRTNANIEKLNLLLAGSQEGLKDVIFGKELDRLIDAQCRYNKDNCDNYSCDRRYLIPKPIAFFRKVLSSIAKFLEC